MLVVPAMAAVTRHIGFGVISDLTYDPPYPFARRSSALGHLTHGRFGWNVVTGYFDSAARGMGLPAPHDHDTHNDVAGESMEVVYNYGKAAAKMARLHETAPTEFSPTGTRSTVRGISAATIRSMRFSWLSRHLNAGRCCIRRDRRRADESSPRTMPNACSSVARTRRSPDRLSAISAGGRPRMGAHLTTSWFFAAVPGWPVRRTSKPSKSTRNTIGTRASKGPSPGDSHFEFT